MDDLFVLHSTKDPEAPWLLTDRFGVQYWGALKKMFEFSTLSLWNSDGFHTMTCPTVTRLAVFPNKGMAKNRIISSKESLLCDPATTQIYRVVLGDNGIVFEPCEAAAKV